MKEALDRYVIRGVTHNISLLRDILTEKRFVEGDISTKYLQEQYPEGFKGKVLTQNELEETLALAACVYVRKQELANSISNSQRLSQFDVTQTHELVVFKNNVQQPVSVRCLGGDCFEVSVAGKTLKLNVPSMISRRTTDVQVNGNTQVLQLFDYSFTGKMKLQYLGTIFNLNVMPTRTAELKKHVREVTSRVSAGQIIAPMPGVIKNISVNVGDMVAEGQELCVLEAMKMQNSLNSSKAGKVKKINCTLGETVSEDAVLIELE